MAMREGCPSRGIDAGTIPGAEISEKSRNFTNSIILYYKIQELRHHSNANIYD